MTTWNDDWFAKVANTIFSVIIRPFKSKEIRPDSYCRYVVLTALRTMTRRMSVRQQQFVDFVLISPWVSFSPPDTPVYKDCLSRLL